MATLEHKYDSTFDSYWKEKSPLIFRVKGSVIARIWPQVAFSLIYSAAVVAMHKYLIEVPHFPPSFMTVLGLVIGLLLVFRTSTGYDRYWEGRKLWSNLTFRVRMMSYSIWLAVKVSPESKTEEIIEKRSAINLLLAFAYATKNYLREEYSHDADEDIEELTPHLDRITNQQQIPSVPGISREGSNSKPTSIKSETGGDPKRKKSKGRVTMSVRRRSAVEKNSPAVKERTHSSLHAHDYLTPTDIPMELVCHFLTYLYKVIEEKKINGETGMVCVIAANDLTNTLTNLERIQRTPIPMAYSIHLHQCIWLYILFLPLQLVAAIEWFIIPGMALASVALLGILAIGWEIENPFGYDDNDLPLDDFCDVLREEVERLIKQPFPKAKTWIYSPHNRPFEPDCSSTVDDLLKMPYPDFANLVMDGAIIDGDADANPTPPPPPYSDSDTILRAGDGGNGSEVTIEVGLGESENEEIVREKVAKTTSVNFGYETDEDSGEVKTGDKIK